MSFSQYSCVDQTITIPRAEQCALAVAYRDRGDIAALERFWWSIAKMCMSFWQKYRSTCVVHNIPMDDFMNEAFVQLPRILERWKDENGSPGMAAKFAALQAIVGLHAASLGVNRGFIQRRSRLRRWIARHYRQFGVGPTDDEMYAEWGGDTKVNRLLAAFGLEVVETDVEWNLWSDIGSEDIRRGVDCVSTSRGLYADIAEDTLDAEEQALNSASLRRLNAVLDNFPFTLREACLLKERFQEEARLLREIGDDWGVSRERIRQIEEALLLRLKHALEASADQPADIHADEQPASGAGKGGHQRMIPAVRVIRMKAAGSNRAGYAKKRKKDGVVTPVVSAASMYEDRCAC